MKYWFKRKYRQIKNVFRWLPIIWKQYDFDYRYSIEVFKFQLQKQAEFLESDRTLTLCAKDKAKRIRTILKLMDKVYEEDYAMEYFDILKEMYGDNVLDWWFEDTGDRYGSSYLRYVYEKWDNAEEVDAKKNELVKASREKQKKAERILWAYIQHNIRHWWD